MQKDFTKEAWDYMRDEKFFAMKIPVEWGGLGFSTHAVSAVLSKLATHCFDANATVAVPNSLGPGELLVRYGTDEQKSYFLPRLADGILIPCFGLTGPHSGSDATSLVGSDCVVERGEGGELGVRATFKKRYITLAPVAGVVGLGLNLSDPDGLLGGVGPRPTHPPNEVQLPANAINTNNRRRGRRHHTRNNPNNNNGTAPNGTIEQVHSLERIYG